MIQLRWKKLDYHPASESGVNVVTVNGAPCVLQSRIHFMPHLNAAGDIVLKKLSEPPEWVNVEAN